MEKHNIEVIKIQNFIINNINCKFTLLRKSSCCFKDNYKNNTKSIDISKLNNIIEINKEQKYIIVEPLITMENILNECLKYNLTIPVLTEFKHMTIGGALVGQAGESRSFIKGLMHDTVLEYEIVCGDGNIIIVNKDNEYSDIFYAIPGSYGSFGIVSYIKICLEKASYYIKLNYTTVSTLNELNDCIIKELDNPTCDYLDCLGENNKFKIIKGYKQYNLSYKDWILNFFNLYFFKFIWYYNHVKLINTNDYIEYLTYYDYTFRWDRCAFWHASKRLSYSLFNRIFLYNSLTCENLYKRANRRTTEERESKKINQDMVIPLDKLNIFFNSNIESHNIFPLWILPIKNLSNKYLYCLNKKNYYVNIGAYGYINNNNNFINVNRKLEKALSDNGGFKCMWSECYYNKDEFWKIYDKEKYDNLRNKYHASCFVDIYTKSCSFYNRIKNEPNLENYNEKCNNLRNNIINNNDDILKFNRRAISYTMANKSINNNMIDMTKFNNILHIDFINQEILVEPGVTMEKLFNETSKYNMVPLILPEFKFLTVGGLIQGTGLESSSFKYGQFNDICSELHFVTESIDDIIIAKKDNAYSDLYDGVSGSLGGLAILTAAKIKLRNIAKHITLTYYKYTNLEEGLQKLESFYEDDIEFLESIVYSKTKMVIITGKSDVLNSNLNLTSLYSWNSEWYYEHVNNVTNNTIYYQDQFTRNDYLFRYDNGAFWMGKYASIKGYNIGEYNIFRKLFYNYFTTDYLYQKLKSKPVEERENRFIIQDMYVPHNKCLNFLDQLHDYVEIYPIWLCPIKATKELQYMAPHYTNECEYMIDVGLWGIPKFGYPFNGNLVNRQIEKILTENKGKKMNYGKFYYTQEEINELYDIKNFNILRKKYNSSRLKNKFNI